MIEVEGLRKEYGDVIAVDGVSFTAKPGEILISTTPVDHGLNNPVGLILPLDAHQLMLAATTEPF